jgi:hypothetical protein
MIGGCANALGGKASSTKRIGKTFMKNGDFDFMEWRSFSS